MTNSAVTDHVRVFHVWLGLGAVAVFLYSGLYMRRQFPEAYAAHDAIRYLYRANHIYILFTALLNLTLGFQLSDAGRRGKGTLQMVASALVAAAVPLLVSAFFVEAPQGLSRAAAHRARDRVCRRRHRSSRCGALENVVKVFSGDAMFQYLRRLARRLIGRGGWRGPFAEPPYDPHAPVREPRRRGPGGRDTAVAVAEPEDREPTRAVGRSTHR